MIEGIEGFLMAVDKLVRSEDGYYAIVWVIAVTLISLFLLETLSEYKKVRSLVEDDQPPTVMRPTQHYVLPRFVICIVAVGVASYFNAIAQYTALIAFLMYFLTLEFLPWEMSWSKKPISRVNPS